jgi:iron(III) transport system ATP-binding protein
VPSRKPVAPGPVKVAVRPEAWSVVPAGPGSLPGRIVKHAYLGSFQELTIATELGEIFVVSPDVQRQWSAGETLALKLAGQGVSVVSTS